MNDVNAANGKITVTFKTVPDPRPCHRGGKLVFSPVANAGSIEWNCTTAAGTTIADKYRRRSDRG